ncbi:MAG: hypothetical protein AB7T49_08695 [Oligoflexales bacterium]
MHKIGFALLSVVFCFSCRMREADDSSIKGVEDGNGGDVYVCKKPISEWDDRRLVFLDLWYAMSELGDFKKPEFDKNDKQAHIRLAKNYLKSIEKLDPYRYEKYSRHIDSFEQEMDLYDTIPNLPDEITIHRKPGKKCEIANIVAQYSPAEDFSLPPAGQNTEMSALSPRYRVQREYWKEIRKSPVDLAVLLLHEVAYRETRQFGLSRGENVTKFVAHMINGRFREENREGYYKFLQNKGFPTFFKTKGGVLLDLTSLKWSDAGELVSGELYEEGELTDSDKIVIQSVGPETGVRTVSVPQNRFFAFAGKQSLYQRNKELDRQPIEGNEAVWETFERTRSVLYFQGPNEVPTRIEGMISWGDYLNVGPSRRCILSSDTVETFPLESVVLDREGYAIEAVMAPYDMRLVCQEGQKPKFEVPVEGKVNFENLFSKAAPP